MILLLIDIQRMFDAARDKSIIQACRREISRARQAKDAIITITYDEEPVLSRVGKALAGYDRWYKTSKTNDNGSEEVLALCDEKKLDTSFFRVCGVNICCCVQKTVFGMLRKLPEARFEFVYDACGCDLSPTRKSAFTDLLTEGAIFHKDRKHRMAVDRGDKLIPF